MADPEPFPPAGPADQLRLEVTAEPIDPEFAAELRTALHAHPVVRSRYPNADLWLVGIDLIEKEAVEGEGPNANVAFRAVLADLAGSDVVEAEGYRWELDGMSVIPTSRPRLPNEEEHAWAEGIVGGNPDLAAGVEAGEVQLYRPVPPLASVNDANGQVLRSVTVGIREAGEGGTVRHRLVAVQSADGEIVAHGEPATGECGVPDGPTCGAAAGEQRARVRVFRGDEVLWNLVVVRPSASSGAMGSGVELRAVEYRRVRALDRAHVPIVNVAYEPGGPPAWAPTSRNWLNEESCFEADGDDTVPGFRTCATAPRTVLERGQGGGDFRGVALWLDGDELVVTSQLEAGWHRYVSEWRLHADGTVRPRLGFGAVANPATCHPHTHHAYWRFDFDVVEGERNQVQEFNEPRLPGQLAPWHTIRYEVARRRDPDRTRQWRVRNVRTPHGYAIVPGPDDGTADAYGAGDVWVLRFHGEEVDDGEGFTTDPARSRAGLDRFLTSELVEREDVVVWYGVHVPQAGDGRGDGGSAPAPTRVGPDLQPFLWTPPPERESYAPLAPPPMPGPEDEDEEDEDEDEA
jgi:hypothetical protein